VEGADTVDSGGGLAAAETLICSPRCGVHVAHWSRRGRRRRWT